MYYVAFTPGDLRFRTADGEDLGPGVDDDVAERRLRIVETPLIEFPRSPDGHLVRSPGYIQLTGTIGAATPFVLWMQTGAGGEVTNHVAVRSRRGWRTRTLGTGRWIWDMEQIGPFTWRIFTSRYGSPRVETLRLHFGRWWRPELTFPVPGPIQRLDVIPAHRNPAHLIISGTSSTRDPATADGDISVAG